MNRSAIEWLHWPDGLPGLSCTPVRGCLRGCQDCWAKSLSRRFPEHYPPDFRPGFYPDELVLLARRRKPARVGMCLTGDLLADWTPKEWKWQTAWAALQHKQHQYLFLTQSPQNYGDLYYSLPVPMPEFGLDLSIALSVLLRPDETPACLASHWGRAGGSGASWPVNWWLGATLKQPPVGPTLRAMQELHAQGAHTFLSLEPLLGDLAGDPDWSLEGIDWMIIGALTGPHAFQPPAVQVHAIVSRCQAAGVPVFAKDNLFGWRRRFRQFPILNAGCIAR